MISISLPFWALEYKTVDQALTHINFIPAHTFKILNGNSNKDENISHQLLAYFKGDLKNFNLKLNPQGTPFQISVWQALQTIPYGETVSYSQIAQLINKPKAVRAVGNAIGKNPIPIIIPCHRVIASDGGLGGYSGGLDKKVWLLEHEQKNLN